MEVCRQCGGELKAGDPAGLCPKCLILAAFDSSMGAPASGTQTIHQFGCRRLFSRDRHSWLYLADISQETAPVGSIMLWRQPELSGRSNSNRFRPAALREPVQQSDNRHRHEKGASEVTVQPSASGCIDDARRPHCA